MRTIIQGQKYKYLFKKVMRERKRRTGEDCPWVTHLKIHLGQPGSEHASPGGADWLVVTVRGMEGDGMQVS